MAKVDRFGNEYKNVACKDRKGRGFPAGFITITRPGTYKLEPGSSNVDGVDAWVRVTRTQNRQPSGGGSFGGRGGYGRGNGRGL